MASLTTLEASLATLEASLATLEASLVTLEVSLATLEASLVILEAWQPWLTLKCKCRYYVLFVLIIDIQCKIIHVQSATKMFL